MKHMVVYRRRAEDKDANWQFVWKHDNMMDAVDRAVLEWKCHSDMNVIVMIFPSATSPFWQGRICWETPGTGLMPLDDRE